MRPPSPALPMTDGQRGILEGLARSRTAPQREVTRAKALLLAGDGVATTAIAAGLGVSPASVTAWRARFAGDGLAEFARVREGRGRKASISAEKVAAIVQATLHQTPPGETHWSCRTMARAQGVSPATVQRIWSARSLQPHRVETFKISNDKRFEEKLVDVVGLYLNPPDKAVVLCMDEKSQIQAYPGGESGVCDGRQESDLTQSSFYRGRVIRGASATGLTAGDGASRAVPGALPGAVPGSVGNEAQASKRLVVDASLTDAYASDPPAETTQPRSQTPDNQALDRTQPSLPLKKGRAGTMTHDCKRNGTTTLFAALDVLTGAVIGQCQPKHRNTEFLRFLRTIDRQV